MVKTKTTEDLSYCDITTQQLPTHLNKNRKKSEARNENTNNRRFSGTDDVIGGDSEQGDNEKTFALMQDIHNKSCLQTSRTSNAIIDVKWKGRTQMIDYWTQVARNIN